MFGWGRKRWMAAGIHNDPERVYFGVGPCGEYMYRLYKEGKLARPETWVPGAGLELILKKLEELERRVTELTEKKG